MAIVVYYGQVLVYRVKEFAKLIGKSPSTLRRWEKEGKIKPSRSVGNQRYYTDKDLQVALNIESADRSYQLQPKPDLLPEILPEMQAD